jgi:anaerobic magnesium-protoporphyrin IX monomethyl ester cyclase
MDPARVVLVQPPVQDYYLTRKRTLPYGLLSMAASLSASGFEADIFDGLSTGRSKPVEKPPAMAYLDAFYDRPDQSMFCLFHSYRHFGYSFDHIARQVKKCHPFLVGISSLFSAYHDTAAAAAAAIRQHNPGIPIVMGGHHPTLFPEEVIALPFVDYVLRGEGEETLPMLCRALKHHTPVTQIPGIACQTPAGPVVSPPHWTPDLSRLPLPEPHVSTHYRRKKQDAVVIVSSRGCPMSCSYCSVSATSGHGRFRKRPVSHVLREIHRHATQREVGFIDFEDENISFDRPWFLELLDGIKALFKDRLVELRAMNGLFPSALDADLIAAMAGAGFQTLNLSVGSFSREQLDRFRRPDVRAAHDRAVAWARDLGLGCVSYVIAAGPDQSPEDSLNDLLYLAAQPTLAGMSIFYPAPGSRDYDRCRRLGLLPEGFSLMRATAFPIAHTTSRIQAVTLLRLSRILNHIKYRMDTGLFLPSPAPAPGSDICLDLSSGREAVSEQLLQWFLSDGNIRGIDHTGQVYVHASDSALTQPFVRAILETPPSGVRPRALSKRVCPPGPLVYRP